MGIDAYIAFFALVGVSMCLLGLNMLATVITMRAPGHDVGPAADLRVGHDQHLGPDAARGAGPDLDAPDAHARPHGADELLQRSGRREPVPLREPLLDLRPSRGLHPRPARHGDRARDPAGVRAQAALGIPPRRHGNARHHAAQLPRLAAPPVRQRHQRRPAAVLHALDRDDLAADRLHLHLRARHALEGAHPFHRADALRARVALQLPDRRAVRRLPVRRAERRDDARQLLLDGALPLHDHGRPALRVLRGRSTTGCRR